MIRDDELKELGVVKSEEGVFLPNDFCLVSLLNGYQGTNPLTDEQHAVISEFLLHLEVDLGICDGNNEHVKRNKSWAEVKKNMTCYSCGKRGTEIFLKNHKSTVSGMSLTIPAVPVIKCLNCGEISYDKEALVYIEQEENRFKETIREDYYHIQSYPDQVELWSTKRLVFEPRGWERLMRDELYRAISNLRGEEAKELYAKYSAEDGDTFDLENVLFYNVGSGAFRSIQPDRIIMERDLRKPESSRPEFNFPCLQLYRFPAPEQFVWKPEDVICFWDVSCPNLKGDLKAEQIWLRMKQGYLKMLMSMNSNELLGMKLKLRIPEQAGLSLFTHIKPLIDGTIAAFHYHNGTDLDKVTERLSVSLRQDTKFIRSALLDSSSAAFGMNRLI